jgi:peptidoglycan/LPS O-acetylase OafA/YrhL
VTITKPSRSTTRYRPEIDGLRALAVAAVIINHFGQKIFPFGYLGVNIFFVISGYVITSSLYRRKSDDFAYFLSDFYSRCVKRLVPVLVFCVVITSILISLFGPNPQSSIKTGLAALFGFSNIFLVQQSSNYFAQAAELNPFTHKWSLGVEEQFYLLFPLFVWFSGFARHSRHGLRNLFVFIGVLAALSLCCFVLSYGSDQSFAYYSLPTLFWEMACGCLAYLVFTKAPSIESFLSRHPPLALIGLIVLVMFLPLSLAVPATVFVVILTVLLLACLLEGTSAHRLLTLNPVLFVGLISYSLYLWHWPVLSLSRWTIGVQTWSIIPLVVLMISFSLFSFLFSLAML